MIYKIENDRICAEVDSFGAELKSMVSKKTNENYIWCADKKVWGKTSPNLFPAIGIIKFGGYRYDGEFYEMTRHGFARDNEFKLVEKKEDTLKLELVQNENTLKLYPFNFSLIVTYVLSGDSLKTQFTVKNNSDKIMPFHLGGHTAFSTENNQTALSDYVLHFDKAVTLHGRRIGGNPVVTQNEDIVYKNVKDFKLSSNIFDDDALMFKDIDAKSVFLTSNSKSGIKFTFDDFKHLTIWTAVGCERYICLEPWTTLPDDEAFDGEIYTKPNIASVKPNEEKSYSYTITAIMEE